VDTLAWVLIGAAVLIVVVGMIAFFSLRERRESERLQSVFGTEYDEAYARAGDKRAAREELKARQERVANYELHALPPEKRREFMTRWQSMQASFVDEPRDAVSRADVLLAEVMRARGYETDVTSEAARIEDVSVGHGDEASAFREAAQIATLNRQGRATTEDLRRAIKDYGVVFDALLNEAQPA
jgi:hypothetical protein